MASGWQGLVSWLHPWLSSQAGCCPSCSLRDPFRHHSVVLGANVQLTMALIWCHHHKNIRSALSPGRHCAVPFSSIFAYSVFLLGIGLILFSQLHFNSLSFLPPPWTGAFILPVISTVCENSAPIRHGALGTGLVGWHNSQVYDLCWKMTSAGRCTLWLWPFSQGKRSVCCPRAQIAWFM